MKSRDLPLLDLRLAELDVLLGDGVIFLHHQLVRHGARVLARHVVEAGVGARDELHLDRGGLGHWEPLLEFGRTLAAGPEMSRKSAFRESRGPSLCPLPLWERAAPSFHEEERVRGILR